MTPTTRIRARKLLPLLALPFPFVAACDDATAPTENARIEVRLTDAPSDVLAEAEVTISAVYLQGGPDDDATDTDGSDDADDTSGRTYLYEAVEGEEPFTVDLLDLQNGVSVALAGAEIEPGDYGQLRFVVDGSRVLLVGEGDEGYTFEDGTREREIRIPSGSTSGIKVILTNDLELEGGETLEVLVDFDVDEAFRFPGMGSGNVVREVMFSPVLRELSRSTDEGTEG